MLTVPPELAVDGARKAQALQPQACDEASERTLLGTILMDPPVLELVAPIVHPKDFYSAKNGAALTLLEQMREERKPIGPDTFHAELRARGMLQVLDHTDVSCFVDCAASSANAEYHAKRIAQTARLRAARMAVAESLSYLTQTHDDPEEQLAHVQSKVWEATRAIERRSSRSIGQVIVDAFTRLERRKRGELVGVMSGFKRLDALTRGFQPGEVTVLAARPSQGKSALAVNVVRNVVREGIPVALFSIEMEGVSLAENLLGSLARVNTLSIRRACMSRSEETALLAAGELAEPWPLTIDDERPVTLRVLRSKCMRLRAEKKLELLVVDYLQMMEADNRGRNRHEEVSEISRGLKALARELEVPVLALAALNRDGVKGETRRPRRPRASDLRESGSIEFDADTILLLHPMYYAPPSIERVEDRAKDEEDAQKHDRTNAVDVIVEKARLGSTGVVGCWFDKPTCFFEEVEYA